MKEKVRNNFLILLFISVIGVLIMILTFQKSTYEDNYFVKLGIKGSLDYDSIVNQLGEPNEKSIIKKSGRFKWTECKYDDFVITFCNDVGDKDYLSNVSINDSKIRFGKDSIGIGSTRSEVEWAYRKVKRINDISELGYVDHSVWIEFVFDDKNEVTKMVVYYGP